MTTPPQPAATGERDVDGLPLKDFLRMATEALASAENDPNYKTLCAGRMPRALALLAQQGAQITALQAEQAEHLADINKLDAAVHALGIEDSHEEPADKIRELFERAETAEAKLADAEAVIEAAKKLAKTSAALDRCVAEFPADPDACNDYWIAWDVSRLQMNTALCRALAADLSPEGEAEQQEKQG